MSIKHLFQLSKEFGNTMSIILICIHKTLTIFFLHRLEREKRLSISSPSPENEGRVYCASREVKIVLVYNCQCRREGLTFGSC